MNKEDLELRQERKELLLENHNLTVKNFELNLENKELKKQFSLNAVGTSLPNTREFTLEVVKEITENHKELEPSYKECLRLGALIGHKIINKLMNK